MNGDDFASEMAERQEYTHFVFEWVTLVAPTLREQMRPVAIERYKEARHHA